MRFTPSAPSQRRRDAARQAIADSGHTVATWARVNGFGEANVYEVLSGVRACVKGESLKIATALGLKDPPPSTLQQTA